MPQARKYARPADRQAAYRARVQAAQRAALEARGLPALPAIPTMPGWPRWRASVAASSQALNLLREEMQTYYDERTEEWQESERGTLHEERLDALDEVLAALEALDF